MALVNFTHHGLSMCPVLIPEDIILVETDHGAIQLGDIVLFKDNECGDYVAHRVVALEPLTTKGDNSPFDELIKSDYVLGIVVGRIRAGRPLNWGFKGTRFKSSKARLSRLYHKKYTRVFRGLFKLLSRLI
ncbi:MAG: hypothetical protein COW00_19450 [Bdellovibrio sp. CG12_big_fil_rev_8_21_14_0_65_39_13]|nr:MAG: hypothetical protein COW78_01520 [Bdellovibrio sp. CG22_combo_CG10-13_8_21_14_all_39_27]PIQ57737.1 MAG: hypothetical protein COW00_19450 [Bdellovibrio sp. CG12_big_fil_rev_8_21_14_0_65_39_13]PIR36533.1 MAG: hypothetical protein COV37_02515 [Bdellovibrio sp. CG11_big_fil_rev_8_21_14_0_20_39_38]